MKSNLLSLIICLCCIYNASSQNVFEKYFENKTLRIDYSIAGNSQKQDVFLIELKQEPHWGGNNENLKDKFNYGNFRFELFDTSSNELIYSKGFNSLFQEWQATEEAKKINKAFYQVNVMPFPKANAHFVLKQRDYMGKYKVIFELDIDPENYFIRKEIGAKYDSSIIFNGGNSSVCVDIAFIAEGYTKDEMEKFRADVKRISEYIFDVSPFKEYKNAFNIYAIESVSDESGTDIPAKGIYKNTIVNSSFYTFDVERYLTTLDIKSLHDIASNVPYDQIFVLINTDKYGGSGMYNYYTCCSADNKLSYEVSSHEFGHGFVGLADEYYTSQVAVDNYYNIDVEPWEPNITTLVDFDSKWKNMLSKDMIVPTPRNDEYINSLGVFEGGGYMSKGVFSPCQDCKMKTNKMKTFCPVCAKACEEMLKFIIGK